MQENTHSGNYQLLIAKLREFKRKYYRNEMLKGGIYFLAFLLFSYIVVALGEYFGHFSTTARTVLFFSFLGINAAILGRYVIMPLFRLFELGKTLSYAQAADIIGKHFGEVKDKLLNTLQLHEQAQTSSSASKALLIASIEQKTEALRPVPFVRAVDYRSNRRYLKYALVPLAVIVILLAQAPNMLLESTERLVAYNKYYEIKAPFDFMLQNESLKGLKGENYTIDLKIKGKELPAEVFVVVNGNPFKMTPGSKTDFSYTLKNLQKDVALHFNANGYTSREYELSVLPKPLLQKFELKLDYPAYIGKKDESIQNTGDLTIPQGTTVSWQFYTENTDKVNVSFDGQPVAAERKGEDLYFFKKRFMQDERYYIKTSNKYVPQSDSIQYRVNVIADAYPGIRVTEEQDSMSLKNLYFTGEVSDDYGFRKLAFTYRYIKSDDSIKMKAPAVQEALRIAPGQLMQRFYHFFDLSSVNIQPGDEIEYFFEVWDNDGVNGSKSSRSQKFFFKAPSLKEIETQTANNNKELEDKMTSATREAKQLQKEMEDARMRMINSKNFDWQDRKAVKDILEKQQKLEEKLQDIQNEYNQNLQQQNEFRQMDENILEKHKQLQELFNEVLDPETKKLFEELQKLMEQNNKDELQKKLDEMKFNNKEVEKELDRMMELFKQLQFEQKLQETIEKLDKLTEEQQKLSEETEEKGADSEELKKKQEELQKEFEDVKKDLDELEKKNEELENEHSMEKTEQQEQDIEKQMEQSQENLEQQKNNKASQNQKKAAEKMKEMSEKLKNMQAKMGQSGQMEDYNTLRQILENLVYVSIEQERLMDDLKKVNQYNPQYVEMGQRQRKLKDDAKIIEDSLFALSKRVVQVKSYINKEIGEINFNMDKALESFGERQTPKVLTHQQYAMTSLNNLALMLSEVMQQMQQSMQQAKSNSNCSGPNCGNKKGSKPSMGSMRELQEKLGQQLEGLKKQMEGKGQQGRQGMSEELARIAAQQEMLRRKLQEMQQQMDKSKEGGGMPSNEMNKIQQLMDKNEEDLLNKRITEETLKRQKEILVRMLEAEKAEKKQEYDEKRESKTADNKNNPTPPALERYLKMKEREVEMLRTVPPSLTPYYKEKVKEYLQGGAMQ